MPHKIRSISGITFQDEMELKFDLWDITQFIIHAKMMAATLIEKIQPTVKYRKNAIGCKGWEIGNLL